MWVHKKYSKEYKIGEEYIYSHYVNMCIRLGWRADSQAVVCVCGICMQGMHQTIIKIRHFCLGLMFFTSSKALEKHARAISDMESRKTTVRQP